MYIAIKVPQTFLTDDLWIEKPSFTGQENFTPTIVCKKIIFTMSDVTNKSCTWWWATPLSIGVAVPLELIITKTWGTLLLHLLPRNMKRQATYACNFSSFSILQNWNEEQIFVHFCFLNSISVTEIGKQGQKRFLSKSYLLYNCIFLSFQTTDSYSME